MVTRRDALWRLGSMAAGAAGASVLAGGGSALGQPSPGRVWGGAPRRIKPVGVQLYTVRDEMQRGVASTLERVAAIGYDEVEFAGYFNHSPEEIRDLLAAVGLKAPATHIPPSFEPDAWNRILDEAARAGHDWVVVPSLPGEMRSSLDAWRRTAEAMTRAAEQARAAGLRFAYHNHALEFEEMEGRVPLDVLCEAADPDLVKIELDLYWAIDGGGDPVAFFQRWPGRVSLVHVKGRGEAGDMVDVGAGVIDWAAIFAHADEAGIEHYFVEHDRPEDSMRSIEASYRYLSALKV
jgi:sugar phosphate isomerase/epimerase